MLQLVPRARVLPQVLLAAKGPVAVMLLMVRAVSPTLMSEKFCPLEWTPTKVAGKVADEGFSATPLTGVGIAK